ncbi:acetolactate synthase small subunit [Capsulimonas corticalis]|uniref:Acetolactate synthase small subunit n=1 Tax=Capsulimonas corticalis TaxID=2219043 RepID=A0A402CY51_9BACT|nr:acetolactate synthase small subunit [Capsulimonas corticalis]BDI31448.1 acetolactate synthase small subunit [Capsulimonas corticalis]
MTQTQQHTISVLVENKPGVLARVALLFSRRGYNIESLAVSITENPSISRMTVVVNGDEQEVEQITKQLHKLIDVSKVQDYIDVPIIARELALIKVNAEVNNRTAILQLVEIFRGRVIDMSDKTFVIEVTGGNDKIDALEKLLEPYGIRELVRTGRIAMARGVRGM